MEYRELLVGVGDSSFCQLPCPFHPLHHPEKGGSRSTDDVAGDAAPQGSTPRISQVACGETVAFAIAATNRGTSTLLAWGTNMYGEKLPSPRATSVRDEMPGVTAQPLLNYPTPVVSPLPPLLMGPKGSLAIQHIACGAHFVVAALETGGCVSWGGGREAGRALGRGSCGSCGLCSSLKNGSTPVAANSRSSFYGNSKPEWVADPLGLGGLKVGVLAAGDSHTIAVCEDGSAWAWGRGDCGQLGSGPRAASVVDTEDSACSSSSAGSACAPVAVRIPGCNSPSFTTTTGVKDDGGPAAQQRLHIGVVRSAACGRDHSAVLTGDGRVWTFGSGLYGQLGLGSVGEMIWTPAAVSALEGVGTMRTDGSFTGIASVACGAWHTVTVSTTGDVYAWGWARFGALGTPPPGNDIPPWKKRKAAVGDVLDAGSDDAAGRGPGPVKVGAMRPTDEGEIRPFPSLVNGIDDMLDDDDQIVSVSCGARYTLAMTRSKRTFVWGQVAPSENHVGGNNHSCGISTANSVRTRGTSLRDRPSRDSFSSPRELIPAELLRAARASAPCVGPTDSCESFRRCCTSGSVGEEAVSSRTTAEAMSVNEQDQRSSLLSVSAVGCGPWYVVLGLEHKVVEEKVKQRRVEKLEPVTR